MCTCSHSEVLGADEWTMTRVAMVPAAERHSACAYPETDLHQNLTMALFDKLMHDLDHDPKVAKDIALGRRVRLYKIRGQLGVGNFSKVKLAVHILAKGMNAHTVPRGWHVKTRIVITPVLPLPGWDHFAAD